QSSQGDHPDLHSFPTRRSSDLTGSRVYITSYDNWRAPVSGAKFDPAKDVWFNPLAFNQGYTTDFLNANFGNSTRNNPKLRSPWKDRKSTRLNSSHRTISYAVFC